MASPYATEFPTKHDNLVFAVDSRDIEFVNQLSQGVYGLQDVLNKQLHLSVRAAVAVANAATSSSTATSSCSIYDIGAHIGTTSIPMTKILPSLSFSQFKITAFEADVDTFKLLQRNVERNGCCNVITCVLGAVGAVPKAQHCFAATEEFVRDGRNAFISRFGETTQDLTFNIGGLQVGPATATTTASNRAVPCFTLDDYNSSSAAAAPVVFMKMDIEGAEPFAIVGARNLILRDRPFIYFEENHKVYTPEMIAALWNPRFGDDSDPPPPPSQHIKEIDFIKDVYYMPPIHVTVDDYLLIPKRRADGGQRPLTLAGKWCVAAGGGDGCSSTPPPPFNMYPGYGGNAESTDDCFVAMCAGNTSSNACIYLVDGGGVIGCFYSTRDLGANPKTIATGIFHGVVVTTTTDAKCEIVWNNGSKWCQQCNMEEVRQQQEVKRQQRTHEIIGTCTTLPSSGKFDGMLPFILSAIRQVEPLDSLEIHVPKRIRRLASSDEPPPSLPPPLPEWTRSHPEVAERIASGWLKINIGDDVIDYGPATKILGCLLRRNDDCSNSCEEKKQATLKDDGDTVVGDEARHHRPRVFVSFDDDILYPDDTVKEMWETFCANHQSTIVGRKAAFVIFDSVALKPCISYAPAADFGSAFLEGFKGIMYPEDVILNAFGGGAAGRQQLKEIAEYVFFNSIDCLKSDDFVLGSIFTSRGIRSVLCPGVPAAATYREVFSTNSMHIEALQFSDVGHAARYFEVAKWMAADSTLDKFGIRPLRVGGYYHQHSTSIVKHHIQQFFSDCSIALAAAAAGTPLSITTMMFQQIPTLLDDLVATTSIGPSSFTDVDLKTELATLVTCVCNVIVKSTTAPPPSPSMYRCFCDSVLRYFSTSSSPTDQAVIALLKTTSEYIIRRLIQETIPESIYNASSFSIIS